jgi:hypothetical protein
MAFTRSDLCVRVLRILNKLDVDTPAEAGDVQLVNQIIEPTIDRLLRTNLIRRTPSGAASIDIGTPDDLMSGDFPPSLFVPIAQIITRDVAPDFGANTDRADKIAAQGEAALAAMRYKGEPNAAAPPAPGGGHASRLHLIYETLQQLGIVSINEPASPDAIDKVDRLISRSLSELQTRSIYSVENPGVYGNVNSGSFPEGDVMALAQILSRPAAMSLGQQFIKGQASEYIQLAGDGEDRLRQMRQELEINDPIAFRDY